MPEASTLIKENSQHLLARKFFYVTCICVLKTEM